MVSQDYWGHMSITEDGAKVVDEAKPKNWVFYSYYRENDSPWTKPERRICVEINSAVDIERRKRLLANVKRSRLITDDQVVSVLERALNFDVPELEIYESSLIAEARRV